jgi:hypothetical protein
VKLAVISHLEGDVYEAVIFLNRGAVALAREEWPELRRQLRVLGLAIGNTRWTQR